MELKKVIDIIKVTEKDIYQLQDIGRQTFQEAFATLNTEQNMTQYLEKAFTEVKLLAELTDPNALFYFATLDHKVIGYLKLNFGPSQTDLKEDNSVEIERIYVLQEYHGKNIGQILFEKAKDIAQLRRADYLWLGVWEENHKAIRFYEKNGFRTFGKHFFMLGTDQQTDLMMKLELKGQR
jgi:diamine N-acetyltransferase